MFGFSGTPRDSGSLFLLGRRSLQEKLGRKVDELFTIKLAEQVLGQPGKEVGSALTRVGRLKVDEPQRKPAWRFKREMRK